MQCRLVGQGLEQQAAGHAAGQMPEHRFVGFGVLGPAVGAEVDVVHAAILRRQSARCVALRTGRGGEAEPGGRWANRQPREDPRATVTGEAFRAPRPRRRAGERRLESVLAITRDILRAPDLDFALESIAQGVAEVFGFRFVTIVISEDDSDVMLRRVMHGFAPEAILEHKNEEISRAAMIALLDHRFESAENCFYLPAEAEADWERSIYSGTLPRTNRARRPKPGTSAIHCAWCCATSAAR